MEDVTGSGISSNGKKGASLAGFCRACRCSCSCGWWTNWFGNYLTFKGDQMAYQVF